MTLCCPNHQARGIPDRESAFSIAKSSCCEVTIFYTMRAPSLGAIAAHPRFPLWRGTFSAAPRHPTRTSTHKRSTNEKKRCTFSTNVSTFGKNSTAFFSPRATTLFPFRHPSRAWARSLAHALSEFSFFAFTARRFEHNPLKTSGLRVKPSPYLLHDISNITRCNTIICGKGRGEGKNAKKGEGKQGEAFTRISLFNNNLRQNGEEVKAKNRKTADARAYARALSRFSSP